MSDIIEIKVVTLMPSDWHEQFEDWLKKAITNSKFKGVRMEICNHKTFNELTITGDEVDET
jgi:hypothetical protein